MGFTFQAAPSHANNLRDLFGKTHVHGVSAHEPQTAQTSAQIWTHHPCPSLHKHILKMGNTQLSEIHGKYYKIEKVHLMVAVTVGRLLLSCR